MTTITTLKQITFTNLMKEFKKYISKDKTRQILQYVYFDGNNFVATDSHILLKVTKEIVSDIPKEIIAGSLINPTTMEIVENIDKKYPDTNRIFPQDCNLNMTLNGSLKEINGIIKDRKKLFTGKGVENLYQFITQDDYLEIRTLNSPYNEKAEILSQYIMRHRTFTESDGIEKIINVQSDYVTKSFGTITKLSKLSKDDIQFKIKGKMQPIVFEQENIFSILVMPVRTY